MDQYSWTFWSFKSSSEFLYTWISWHFYFFGKYKDENSMIMCAKMCSLCSAMICSTIAVSLSVILDIKSDNKQYVHVNFREEHRTEAYLNIFPELCCVVNSEFWVFFFTFLKLKGRLLQFYLLFCFIQNCRILFNLFSVFKNLYIKQRKNLFSPFPIQIFKNRHVIVTKKNRLCDFF